MGICIITDRMGDNIFSLMRFGFVAAVRIYFSKNLLLGFPITLDASDWYSGYGYAALAVFYCDCFLCLPRVTRRSPPLRPFPPRRLVTGMVAKMDGIILRVPPEHRDKKEHMRRYPVIVFGRRHIQSIS